MGGKDWQKPLLKELAGWARERFPLVFPVRCYVRPAKMMMKERGYFLDHRDGDDKLYGGLIAISDCCRSQDELMDVFVEEWAHARVEPLLDKNVNLNEDDPNFPESSHDPVFWAQYGMIRMAARRHWCYQSENEEP